MFLAAVILTLATPLVAAKTSVYQAGGHARRRTGGLDSSSTSTKPVTIDGKLRRLMSGAIPSETI